MYDGKLEDEAILEWVKTASTPLVGELGPETYSKYMAVCLASSVSYLSKKRN